MLLSQSSNNNYNNYNNYNNNNNNNLALCQVFFGSVKVCSIYECVCGYVCVCVDFTCNLLLCFIACLIFIMIIIVGIT